VPPDWLGDICLHVATLLASFASIYYVYRDLRKGSHKRAQADGIAARDSPLTLDLNT